MRIISKTQLLEVPVGTIFFSVEPNSFEELMIFDGKCGDNDFFFKSIDRPWFAEATDSFEMDTLWDKMQYEKSSATIDLDISQRDGLFEHDGLYMVLEEKDVKLLIDKLQHSLQTAYPHLQL